MYLFILGCAGSSLLCGLFRSCGKWGLLSSCGARASDCAGFFCSGAQAGVLGLQKLRPACSVIVHLRL